jgi:ABC-type glycerol-3-phosphate transport system permease component
MGIEDRTVAEVRPAVRARRQEDMLNSLVLNLRGRYRDLPGTILAHLALILVGAISLLPLLWMVSTSFKDTMQLYQYPPQFIPSEPTVMNYLELPRYGFHLALANSVFVSTAVTIIVVLTTSLAGYAFAKLPVPGGNVLFVIVLSGLMVPWMVIAIPLFVFVARLGWANTYAGIIIPMCASPFGIFVMRQFLLGIPTELMESARMDGASELGIFWRIVLPLAKPALAALSTLVFLGAWNAFLWPLLVSSRQEKMVISVAIALFQHQYTSSYGLMMAAATVGFVPILVLYLAFQSYFVQGIALTGIKG